MSNEVSDRRFTFNMTPTEAHSFVTKLATDDEFRERLSKNAREVLAEHHIDVPLELLPPNVQLPAKESLQSALDRFTNHAEMTYGELVPSNWPFVMFWWLYLTPAKPSRRGASDVR